VKFSLSLVEPLMDGNFSAGIPDGFRLLPLLRGLTTSQQHQPAFIRLGRWDGF